MGPDHTCVTTFHTRVPKRYNTPTPTRTKSIVGILKLLAQDDGYSEKFFSIKYIDGLVELLCTLSKFEIGFADVLMTLRYKFFGNLDNHYPTFLRIRHRKKTVSGQMSLKMTENGISTGTNSIRTPLPT